MKVAARIAHFRPISLLCVCLVFASSFLFSAPLQAQTQPEPPSFNGFLTGPTSGDPLQIAMQYVQSHGAAYGLSSTDLSELRVVDRYTTAHNGVTHIVLRQQLGGIDVFQGDIAVNVARDGSIINVHNAAIPQLAKRVNTRTPKLSAQASLVQAATTLGLHSSSLQGAPPDPVQSRAAKGVEQASEFVAAAYSVDPIPVHLIYQPLEDGSVVLAWNMVLRLPDGQSWLDVRTDATTGEIVSQVDWSSASGHVHEDGQTGGVAAPARVELPKETVAAPALAADGASYLVYPFDVARPDVGTRTLVTNPADPVASPYGWHDTDGVDGAEYTITRGNNTFTYADITTPNGYNAGDVTVDGGPSLTFTPALDFNQYPSTYRDASITQLFYTTNMLHDTLYHYGFDEVSGNFQTNNYGRGGLGDDAVNAEAQDFGGADNANFFTPPDGQTPQMQMYLGALRGRLIVQSPASIAGMYYGGSSLLFSGAYNVSAELALAQDGVDVSTDACSALTNAAAVAGKIVLIDRGTCSYADKVLNVANAGGLGVIIANNVGTNVIPDMTGDVRTIPSMGISYNDGQTLRNALQSQTVTLTMFSTQSDGSFDTGVVMHEYGHGLSNRLTGGPATSGCLVNAESRGMGEGWSDLLALALLAKPSDTRQTPLTVGTWLMGQSQDGAGIRIYPYSTDSSVNPHTYASLNSMSVGSPHDIGEVWVSIMWEVYWDLVDAYGFDPDKVHGTGGNNLFLQLMIDGMKLQKCNPSFVDARDAILLADQVNNAGANQCLLWAAFARRGLGASATGVSSLVINDSVEAFDLPPTCTVNIEEPEFDVCVATSPQLTANIQLASLLSYPTTLSASGVPGAVATFTPNPVVAVGTSTLALNLSPSTPPDTYTLTVEETSGTSDTALVYLANQVPGTVTLTAPADQATDVFHWPTFMWAPGTQTYSYTIQVAKDAAFSDVLFSQSTRDTSVQLPIPLETQGVYYWRVVGNNACGSSTSSAASFTVRQIPQLLLVDDDVNLPNVLGDYMFFLDQIGIDYDYWETGVDGTYEPSYLELQSYRTVLWFGGPSSYGVIGDDAEAELARFLDDGKCLVISSQDYFIRKGSITPFMSDYLGLSAAQDDPGQSTITGAGPFAGLGPFPLNVYYFSTNYSDSYVPTAEAGVAFTGEKGPAAVYRDTTFRTVLMGFAVEGLADAAAIQVLKRALNWCTSSDLVASGPTLDTLLPGQPFSYTVAVSNTSTLAATDVTVTLTLPSFLSDVQVTSSLPMTPTATAGVWSLGDLAVGANGTVTIQAVVDPSLNSDRSDTLKVAFDISAYEQDISDNSVQTNVDVVVPRISFASASASAAESAGSVPVGVKLDRANPYAPTSATVAVTGGTATQGSDFTLGGSSVTFAPGATTASINVTLLDDNAQESDETVVLGLTSPVGGQLGAPASTTLTITDNDQPTPDTDTDTDTTVKLYLPVVGR